MTDARAMSAACSMPSGVSISADDAADLCANDRLKQLDFGCCFDLGQEQPVDAQAAIGAAPTKSRRPSSVRRPLTRSARLGSPACGRACLQPVQHLLARLGLTRRVHGVFEIDAHQVGAGGHGLGEALGLFTGDEQHRTGV